MAKNKKSGESEKSDQMWMYIIIGIMIIIICAIILFGVIRYFIKKHRRSPSQKLGTRAPKKSSSGSSLMNDPSIVQRFGFLRNEWYKLSNDQDFLSLIETLMMLNSNSPPGVGSRPILQMFQTIDEYCNKKFNDKIRVTLIYKDGIVFYDSVLPIERVFYMKDNLPAPVSMATLGSPLKDHNVVPEVTNSIIVHQLDDLNNSLEGMKLTDKLYPTLIKEGFGFCERVSSSLNTPYSYVARFVVTSVDPTTKFINGCTLRVSKPISSSEEIDTEFI